VARQNALAKDRSKAKAGAQQQSDPANLRDPRRAKPTDGPAAAAELDRLIHERVRLAIVSALAGNESLTFNDLKRILNTTDGNLSVHARKLEDAQYIVCKKSFDGRTPKTEYQLTDAGRKAFNRYLGHMESVIRAARGG
jgi:DNA-binding HxlR family transcriptional regulator